MTDFARLVLASDTTGLRDAVNKSHSARRFALAKGWHTKSVKRGSG